MKKNILGFIMAAIALFILFYLRQFNVMWFDVLILLFLFQAVNEMDSAFRKSGYSTIRPMLILASLSVYPMFLFLGLHGVFIAFLISFMVGAVILTFNHKLNYKDLMATSFILIYPMFFIILYADINHNIGGLYGIFTVLLIVLLSDTCAQWIGSAFKGKKLCPTISPNKTVAGAIGAIIGGVLASAIIFFLFEYFKLFESMANVNYIGLTNNMWSTIPFYIVYPIIGTGCGMLGDLFASWLKREFGIKDYSTFLSAHGGIMDRADSIMFAMPVFYLIFLFLPNLAQ